MAFITRGSTPENTFVIPVDEEMVEDIIITYAQNNVEIFRKEMADCTFDGYTVSCSLTQEETLMLSSASPVQIQLKIQTGGGNVIVSEEVVIGVKKALNEEVM